MRTSPAAVPLPEIAVETERLQSEVARIAGVFQPLVDISVADLRPMDVAIVVGVIDRQKLETILPAAGALDAIDQEGGFFQLTMTARTIGPLPLVEPRLVLGAISQILLDDLSSVFRVMLSIPLRPTCPACPAVFSVARMKVKSIKRLSFAASWTSLHNVPLGC